MLAEVSKYYEVIVFTASYQCYADAILDQIDKEHKWIHHRLYRQHCVKYGEDFYVKDLSMLGRDLKNVIIVDNSPYAFALHLRNGYPIIPYNDDKEDQELEALAQYLIELKGVDDIRAVNDMRFQLQNMCTLGIEKYLQYYQNKEDEQQHQQQQELIELQASLEEFFKFNKAI